MRGRSTAPTVAVRWLALCLAALLSIGTPAVAGAAEVAGVVSLVIDGDSLWLRPADGGRPLELRLEGIDAPEICQPWGLQSRQALADAVLNQAVTAQISGLDEHGRSLATVLLAGTNINKQQVMEGQAWSYRYKYDRGPYVGPERVAIALHRGLHASAGAVMPREFRRSNGPCKDAPASATGP